MQIKPKFPRFCGSVRYRDAGHTRIGSLEGNKRNREEKAKLKERNGSKKEENKKAGGIHAQFAGGAHAQFPADFTAQPHSKLGNSILPRNIPLKPRKRASEQFQLESALAD